MHIFTRCKLMEKQFRNKGREGREEGGRRSKDGGEEGDKQEGGKYKEMNQLKVGAMPLKGRVCNSIAHTQLLLSAPLNLDLVLTTLQNLSVASSLLMYFLSSDNR